MTDFLTKSELKKLQAAIDIEVKHQYIDIRGRECPFSVFMKKETKKIYQKSGKNPKWEALISAFEFYPYDTFVTRKRTITRFVTLLKQELNPNQTEEETKKENRC